MNNKKEYVTPAIEIVSVSFTHVIMAASDHHTDDNFSKKNNMFMNGTETDNGNVFSNE